MVGMVNSNRATGDTGDPIFFILALVSTVYALCIGIAHTCALERGILGDESERLVERHSGLSSRVKSGRKYFVSLENFTCFP